jgi:hypothetical protein
MLSNTIHKTDRLKIEDGIAVIRATNRIDALLKEEFYVQNDRIPTQAELLAWVQEP